MVPRLSSERPRLKRLRVWYDHRAESFPEDIDGDDTGMESSGIIGVHQLSIHCSQEGLPYSTATLSATTITTSILRLGFQAVRSNRSVSPDCATSAQRIQPLVQIAQYGARHWREASTVPTSRGYRSELPEVTGYSLRRAKYGVDRHHVTTSSPDTA